MRVSGAAQEATIRRNLAERLPNLPKIDEVSKTPVEGLYEVRLGHELFWMRWHGVARAMREYLETGSSRYGPLSS